MSSLGPRVGRSARLLPPQPGNSPALGAVHDDTATGLEYMKREGNRADHGTDDSRHGNGPDQRAQWGTERSIRPGSPVPLTVLVAEMGDGALLLQGWRIGPAAYLTAEDAAPMRQALVAAFGGDPSGVALPEHTAEPD
ncbi:MAG: hypothetical protein ACRDTG_15315 [Pseudonocardiaceae bacterium]